jgi:superfamily II DNA or RNA helicase
MKILFKIISDGIDKAYHIMKNGKEYRQYQVDALRNLSQLRTNGEKKALVKISTG